MLFLAFLISKNRKSSTIKSYVSAIKAVLLNIGVEVKENKVLLASLTQACKLQNDRAVNKLPIKKSVLLLILSSLDKIFAKQPYLLVLYRAIFMTAYFGLFHIGEVTFCRHVIKAKDVHVGMNKDKLMFILHSSKTHGKHTKPQIVKI